MYLGAGTGLGTGYIINGKPQPSEGGHTRFAVET